MPYLEIKLGPDSLLVRMSGRVDYVLGRLPRTDIQLRDMKISRVHSQVFLDSRGIAWVRDLGSSTGTLVNQHRLKPGEFAPLLDGTKLSIGEARVKFRDDPAPANAIDPPGMSKPHGLIRTNARRRAGAGDDTLLEIEDGAPPKQGEPSPEGPAEPPPEVKAEDFAGEIDEPALVGAREKKRRDTGIVEAPWEKRESGRFDAPQKEKRLTVRVNRGSRPMPTADIDHSGATPKQPSRTTRKRVPPIPVPDDPANFRPPPPIQGEMPIDDESSQPKRRMPTVRLNRPSITEQAAEEPEPEPAIPSARELSSSAPVPPDRDFPEEVDIPQEDDLTGGELAAELGAGKNYGDVDFSGDGDDLDKDEAVFGAAAVSLTGDEDIDIDTPPQGSGEKTVFVPRPAPAEIQDFSDDFSEETGTESRRAENLDRKSLDDMAQGPGGDTIAIPAPMLGELRGNLASKGKRRIKPPGAKHTDLLRELDDLPEDRKADPLDEPDTLVE